MWPVPFLIACFLAALAFPAFAAPDEELLGKAKGYPVGTRANWFFDEGVRVGSFSHLDEILPHYTLNKAQSPLPLAKAAAEVKLGYRFESQAWTLGEKLRARGSVHSDWWTGTASELADCGHVGVYPVIGWWRERPQFERWNHFAE